MFDISGLTPVPIQKNKKPLNDAHRYYSSEGVLIAKTCRSCSTVKEIADFSCQSANLDGRQAWCRECMKGYRSRNKEHLDEVRQRYYEANEEHLMQKAREYRMAHKEEKASYNRRYYLEHYEDIREWQSRYASAYYIANRDTLLEKNRRNYQENRDRLRPLMNSRRAAARSRNLARSSAEIETDRLRLRPDGTKWCRSCKSRLPLGSFGISRMVEDGLQPVCKPCDRERHGRSVKSYWNAQGIPLECYICSGPFEEVEHVWATSTGGPDVPQNTLPVCAECNHGQGGKHTQMLLTYLWERFGAKEASVILRRVTMEYGVWPFDQPYVAEDWEVSA